MFPFNSGIIMIMGWFSVRDRFPIGYIINYGVISQLVIDGGYNSGLYCPIMIQRRFNDNDVLLTTT